MNTARLKQVITHPAFISLVMLAVVLIVLPLRFPKYRVRNIDTVYLSANIYLFYSDLDSDGNSEQISCDVGDEKQTKIIVSRNEKIIKQYNLRFQPKFFRPFWIDDYNSDGYKEIYVFTMNDDSVLLNIIDPLKSKKILVSGRYIDQRRKVTNSVDAPNIVPVRMIRKAGRTEKDFLFYIVTGYSLQPRRVYRYIIGEDSLVKSPLSGAVICNIIPNEIDMDQEQGVVLTTLGTGNLDGNFPFSDNYSWLMVLDDSLKFMFPPKPMGLFPSRTQAFSVRMDGKANILAFYDNFGSDTAGNGLYLFDMDGSEIRKKSVSGYEHEVSRIFPGAGSKKETFFFLKDRQTTVEEMDYSFRETKVLKMPEIATGELFIMTDADFDGKQEYFFLGAGRDNLIIVKKDFRHPAVWKHNNYDKIPLITTYYRKGEAPRLFAQFDKTGIFFRYEKNPYYFLKYPVYPVLYGLIYLFVLIIARAQRYRLNLIKEHEKKLVELQMKSIKNQIDPHFTLNVLNAIGSLYSEEGNREKADYIFAKYAKLIRQTVISSDKVIVTIEEELDFVRNYIEIEKFRYGNLFDFSIDIRGGSDLKTRIPRMLIHTFVENAVKYGIRNRAGGGILKIILQKNGSHQSIIIENNGPFLDAGNPSLNGTGKGLIILNDLIGMFQKLENIRITYNVETISDEAPESQVTRAVILVPCM